MSSMTADDHSQAASNDRGPVHAQAPSWTDGKRYAWLLGLLVPALPFGAWLLAEATGLGITWWLGPAFVFGLMPLLDHLGGTDQNNPPEAAVKWLEEDRYYRWCTYLFIPLQMVSLVFSCWMWSRGVLSPLESIGLAVSLGMVNGIAIANAHELGHKREAIEQLLARIALAPTGYGHFPVEHNRGHHVRVATPEDPASSRLGESFYRFWPRTVSGSLRSAWHLERERLARGGHGAVHPDNMILRAWSMTLTLYAALVLVFGPAILPYLLVQAVVGFSLLEVVNYIEHYGLRRQTLENGRVERCQPRHSWNSNIVASNVFLWHLQRHSDHHANATRRYQSLRHFDEAPQLPSGYAGMIVLALVPPLWRRVMDPRVLEHYGGDASMANRG